MKNINLDPLTMLNTSNQRENVDKNASTFHVSPYRLHKKWDWLCVLKLSSTYN